MNKNSSVAVVIHIITAVCIYLLLYHLKIINILPDNINLVNWDAKFHKSIVDRGYEYVAYRGTNLAFFPLFPLLWKVTSFSAVAISIANALIFMMSFILLMRNDKSLLITNLLILSIPSFIFFALPYSESIFFAFATLIIVGYKSKSNLWLFIGFFGASLVKSASVIFIPAIFITQFVAHSHKENTQSQIKQIILCSLSSLTGMCVAASVQAYQTGKWFYFIEIQKYWGRHWIIPELPLTTLSAERILGIDSIALILGMLAMYKCFYWLYIYFINTPPYKERPEAPVLFSALYLSASTFLDLFFTYNDNGAGNIWSLNRHFFCSPFVVIFLVWIIREYNPVKKELSGLIILVLTGIYLTGVYRYPILALYYLLFFLTLWIMKFYPRLTKYMAITYLISLGFQLQFFKDFISDEWIG